MLESEIVKRATNALLEGRVVRIRYDGQDLYVAEIERRDGRTMRARYLTHESVDAIARFCDHAANISTFLVQS